MELNRKIFKIGIILISLSLITSLGLATAMKLDKPVFLKNYTESMISASEPSYRGSEFVLKYITNVSDKRRITDIYFEEYPDLVLYAGSNSSRVDIFPIFPQLNHLDEEIYGRYALRNLYVTIDGKSLGEFNEIELNSAKITFNNGEVMNADLGRIIFYNYLHDRSSYKGEHFDGGGSSSSSDGTSSTTINVNDDIIVTNLDSPLLKNIDDLVEIKIKDIDYKDISEIHYKNGNTLRVNSVFQQPKDILKKFTLYNIEPKVYYRDLYGNSFYTRIYNIGYENYEFNTWQILKYLKARGEI